jgi:hypothetical protein
MVLARDENISSLKSSFGLLDKQLVFCHAGGASA